MEPAEQIKLLQQQIELLEKRARLQQAEFQKQFALLEAENKLLRQKIDLLIRRIFGRKSEIIDDRQLEFLFKELGEESPGQPEASGTDPEPEAAPKSRKPRKRKTPEPKYPEDGNRQGSLPILLSRFL